MNAIEVNALSKRYGPVLALHDVTFSVQRGEVIGLLGPNGAGKTTLMKALTGYHQPDLGEIRIAGIDVVSDPLSAQKSIGYLPESAPLYDEMTVQEYLLMMAELRGVDEDKRLQWISDAVHATALYDYLTRPIKFLSKGYRQRVGIAQAILHKPDFLILDEPTSGLDPSQIAEIRELIKRLAKHSTVMLSTHILPEVELTCERVLIIMQGTLRADAKVADLQATNAAIVAVKAGTDAVRKTLESIDGVDAAEPDGSDSEDADYRRWRVSSRTRDDLCTAIFTMVRENDWMISELRPSPRALESVFHDLASDPQAKLDLAS